MNPPPPNRRSVAGIPKELLATAPRKWMPNAIGVRVRVIDPKWIEEWHLEQEAIAAWEALIAERQQDIRSHIERVADIIAGRSEGVVTPFERTIAELDAIMRRRGITSDELFGPSRKRAIVEARADCYAFLQKKGWSLPRIGRMFRKDHTTILNGIQRRRETTNAA
ncbi:dnaA protein helix-turn-helix [Fulvimarina manganoxydans]|uniref:DnaA protein helix-turn-helix n=1 Tax=Fulvimarina manganoxydans TaxID=937218 RepID=A0A1W1Z311_9HYPH|nr:helix-turn-helix domain-containing protein [Fulvimarina manganoxydans]SMC42776.1 dnaA protein helix-turn-helix [Fulvimarina manganoxydans]